MLLILYSTVYFFLIAVNGAFIIRMLMSFFTPEAEGPIVGVIVFLTEIFIAPIRVFIDKKGWFSDSPLDVSFFFGAVFVNMLLLILDIF